MFPSQSLGYDRGVSVFSPEGRLYQVEYATEAVRHGPLAVGVKSPAGVVLVGEKRTPHPLVDITTIKKILLIDDHIGTAIAGLHADARKLIDQARIQAQINRLNYDEPILVHSLIENICDTKQAHTQYGGARPFGVSLLVAGVDDHGTQLYTTDPSGSFWGWKAAAIGKESDVVRDFFKEHYKPNLDMDGVLKLAMDGFMSAKSDAAELEPAERALKVEIGKIEATDKTFSLMTNAEVEALFTAQ